MRFGPPPLLRVSGCDIRALSHAQAQLAHSPSFRLGETCLEDASASGARGVSRGTAASACANRQVGASPPSTRLHRRLFADGKKPTAAITWAAPGEGARARGVRQTCCTDRSGARASALPARPLSASQTAKRRESRPPGPPRARSGDPLAGLRQGARERFPPVARATGRALHVKDGLPGSLYRSDAGGECLGSGEVWTFGSKGCSAGIGRVAAETRPADWVSGRPSVPRETRRHRGREAGEEKWVPSECFRGDPRPAFHVNQGVTAVGRGRRREVGPAGVFPGRAAPRRST
jgi:hypothetical protein